MHKEHQQQLSLLKQQLGVQEEEVQQDLQIFTIKSMYKVGK